MSIVRCLPKVILLLLVYGCCVLPAMAVTDSLPPVALQQQLDQYRQADQLEAWIYARTDYAEAGPQSRLSFLMQTQAAAWRSFTTYDERLAWFNLLLLQGYYQLQSGNILASIKGYEAALQFYEAYPLPDADNILDYLLKPLGNNYTRLGDYEAALFIHDKTMQLAKARGDRQEMAAAYNNMAISTRWQGDLPAALQYCRLGLQLAGASTPLYSLLLSTQAEVYQEAGQYDSARIVVDRAIAHLRRFTALPEARYWYGSALQAAAQVALKQQQYAIARRYVQEAARWFQQYFPDNRPREKAKIDVLTGDVYLATGQPQAALQAYQSALQRLLPGWQPASAAAVPPGAQLYSESLLADALTGKGRAFTRLGKQVAALAQYDGVFAAVYRLQQAFYHTSARLQEQELAKARANEAMQLAQALWVQTAQPAYRDHLLLIAEQSKAQVLAYERNRRHPTGRQATDSTTRKVHQLQEAVVYYERELATHPQDTATARLLQAADYELMTLDDRLRYAATGGVPVTAARLSDFRRQLPLNCIAIEFFAGKDSTWLIEFDQQTVHGVRVIEAGSQTEAVIRNYMNTWYQQGPQAMLSDPQAFFAAGYALYQRIFGDRTWQSDKRYLLIPDGQYSYLPFEALPVRNAFVNNYGQWPYLLRETTLSQAYSLQTWYEQQTTKYEKSGFTGFFISKGASTRQATLMVQDEYAQLRQQVSGNYYVDSVATWQQFIDHARDQGVLHISSHAVAAGKDTQAYLQLYDQPFYLFDLRYRSFAPTLVVLGACQTADGAWLAGEGVNSLSRAFTGAGAGGVIAGRWNVNDLAGTSILLHFYGALSQQQDAAASLHKAKLQYIDGQTGNTRLQLPYYWAALTYSGHWQPIRLERPVSGIGWYWWAGGVLLLLGGLAYWKFA
ncbi:CHAT domain-containing protein [Paraflavitalea pollutisoli]|uniref:CHAT domain-containing protein n=1 Tax=Paraflavitalea pollutisoli TaxID=3034143 RepID=UPI0023ED0972|nr:CHAT domain-containing tetratricopeptide repeat protein [Paraflavitalea sp. H1-2-19X]